MVVLDRVQEGRKHLKALLERTGFAKEEFDWLGRWSMSHWPWAQSPHGTFGSSVPTCSVASQGYVSFLPAPFRSSYSPLLSPCLGLGLRVRQVLGSGARACHYGVLASACNGSPCPRIMHARTRQTRAMTWLPFGNKGSHKGSHRKTKWAEPPWAASSSRAVTPCASEKRKRSSSMHTTLGLQQRRSSLSP